MREHGTDPATGLMISALNPDEKTAAVPRGCALGWSILFLTHLDPQFAAAEYQRFRAAMFVDYGPVGGFREYPAGREGPADMDSGPILFGVGVAATGFGLGAARLMGDEPAFRRMMTMGNLAGFPAWWRGRRWYRTAGPIGNAIMLCCLTAGPWPDDPSWPDLSRPSAPPAGPGAFPLLLAGLWLLLLYALVRGLDLSPRSGTPRSRVRPVLALVFLTGILAAASLWWPFSTFVISLAALAVTAVVWLLWALGRVLRRSWGAVRRNPRP
jgi:hypothetical protein